MIIGLLLVAFIGFGYYLAGVEIAFSLFYFIPISLVVWFAGGLYGTVISFISITVWLLTDLSYECICASPAIPYWNAIVRLCFFLIVVKLLSDRKHAEKVLIRQSKELARSNAELEQYASVASHDLQEPLRVVSNYLQLLGQRCKDRLDADAVRFISCALNAVRRMYNLINDLLEYSRLGHEEKKLALVDCSKTLGAVLDNLKVIIEKYGVVVTSDFLPTVMVVEQELIQIFQNLIGNAIKYKREDPPRIHISARQNETKWIFSVKDNGIGIESQYYQKIFNIFQRLHTRDEYPGTGMGLAICKKIVESYSGQIWVESEYGKGSTFYFTILDTRR